MSKLRKVFSRISRSFIYKLDGVNTRRYMKRYNKWLKKNGVKMSGSAKYIHHTAILDGSDFSRITLGDKCVISLGVVILTHDFSLETGMISLGKGSENEAHFEKEVVIGNNCFIGANSIILPGVILGDNCIVGAGTVLSGKTYPDCSIIVGNPAKVIGNTKEWAKCKVEQNGFVRGFYN